MNAIQLVLSAYDDTGAAYDSATSRLNTYASDVESASSRAAMSGSSGFGALAIGAVVTAAKFALVGGAIVGAGYLVYKNWDAIKSTTLRVVSNIADGIGSFIDYLRTTIGPSVVAFANDFIKGWSAIFSGVKEVVTGIINALISGDFQLAGQIALGGLEVAFELSKATITGIWNDTWVGIVGVMNTYMPAILSAWNQLVGVIAEASVSLFLDSDAQKASYDKFTKNLIELGDKGKALQKELDAARAAGDAAETARLEKNVAINKKNVEEMKKVQATESPEAAKAAAQAAVRRATQDVQIKIDTNTLAGSMADAAAKDAEERAKRIAEAQAKLAGNITKAQNQAGPNAISGLFENVKGKAFSFGKELFDSLFGPARSDPSAVNNQLAQLQNDRFTSGAGAASRESIQAQMLKKQEETNGLLKFAADWMKQTMGRTTTAAVTAGVNAAKGGGLKL